MISQQNKTLDERIEHLRTHYKLKQNWTATPDEESLTLLTDDTLETWEPVMQSFHFRMTRAIENYHTSRTIETGEHEQLKELKHHLLAIQKLSENLAPLLWSTEINSSFFRQSVSDAVFRIATLQDTEGVYKKLIADRWVNTGRAQDARDWYIYESARLFIENQGLSSDDIQNSLKEKTLHNGISTKKTHSNLILFCCNTLDLIGEEMRPQSMRQILRTYLGMSRTARVKNQKNGKPSGVKHPRRKFGDAGN